MFTFKLYKGDVETVPPQKIIDMPTAMLIAENFSKVYQKVEIILNDNLVVKIFENPTVHVTASASMNNE